MREKILCLCLAFSLAITPAGAQVPTDPDVAKGVKQVDEGDYDAAILTLDNAARHLAADPSKSRELSYAYLYLGIAYMGKGHEAAAKAKFREAVSRLKDLSLSPDKFSPKIIDLFETVKEETAKGDGPAKAPAKASSPAAPTPKAPTQTVSEGGGGGKTLLFVGLGVAAAAGAILVLKGGGECLASPAIRDGRLTADDFAAEFPVGRGASGEMSAELSWRSAGSTLGSSDVQMVVLGPGSNPVALGTRIGDTSRRAAWPAGMGATRVRLQLQGNTPVDFSLKLPDCP